MKKALAGILFCLAVLCQPVYTEAANQGPKPIEVTYEEARELMKIAYCEAGNQGVGGQLYVMSVIINRVESPDYPDNIHDVIYAPHQFATAGMDDVVIIPRETHLALCYLEMGNKYPNIIAFGTRDSDAELMKYFTPSFVHRDHLFYVPKKK